MKGTPRTGSRTHGPGTVSEKTRSVGPSPAQGSGSKWVEMTREGIATVDMTDSVQWFVPGPNPSRHNNRDSGSQRLQFPDHYGYVKSDLYATPGRVSPHRNRTCTPPGPGGDPRFRKELKGR